MLRAAQATLVLLAVTSLLAQAPQKPSAHPSAADREHARQLLSRATNLIPDVEAPGDRVTLLWQLGLAHSQSGDSQAGSAALLASFEALQALPAADARTLNAKRHELVNAYARAGDIAGAQRVVAAAPESDRESFVETLVRSVAFQQQPKLRDAATLAMDIKNETRRERLLVALLREWNRNAPPEDVEYLLGLLATPSSRAVAQAHLGAAKIRSGDLGGDQDLTDATRTALSAGGAPSMGGTGYWVGCADRDQPRESERDSAVRHVAQVRLDAGDVDGALASLSEVEALPGREDLLARIAVHQARKGDLAAAQQSASRITRATCRDNALGGVASARLKVGDVSAALQIASSLSTPLSRAETLHRIARRELAAKRAASALQIASEGFKHANQIDQIEWRMNVATWLAMLQAEAGALALARENMQQITREFAKAAASDPHRSSLIEVRRVAVCQAGIGDAMFAISTLQPAKSLESPSLLLSMARHQSNVGDVAGALQWIEGLSTPAEKAFALIGAAAGLLAERTSYGHC